MRMNSANNQISSDSCDVRTIEILSVIDDRHRTNKYISGTVTTKIYWSVTVERPERSRNLSRCDQLKYFSSVKLRRRFQLQRSSQLTKMQFKINTVSNNTF